MLSEAAVKVFSHLLYLPDAESLVNVLPFGGVYWADEMPHIRQFVHCVEHDRAEILRMFSLRLEVWNAGGLSDGDQEFWDSVRAQVPTWPLFRRLELTDEQKLARQKAEQRLAQEFAGFPMQFVCKETAMQRPIATTYGSIQFCWICSTAVSLETCKIDEHGNAVHEECYRARIGLSRLET